MPGGVALNFITQHSRADNEIPVMCWKAKQLYLTLYNSLVSECKAAISNVACPLSERKAARARELRNANNMQI